MTSNILLITTLLGVFSSAIAGGFIAHKLRLPALLGYIAAGVLVGNLLSQFTDHEFLTLIAESGVTLLLFSLGVEFSFHRLRKILHLIAWAAILQIIVSIGVFLLIFVLLGWDILAAVFVAAAFSLSSTAIVIKVLSERGELESVPGEALTGWLVIQDLAVIPIMIILPTLAGLGSTESPSFIGVIRSIGGSMLLSTVLLFIVMGLAKLGIPKLLKVIAGLGSREVFVVTTVGIIFLAAVAAYSIGLSAALGAFIAGLLIAETTQNHAIFAEIRPLRDIFAVVFFVSVGMALPVSGLLSVLPVLIFITLFIMVSKFALSYVLTRFVGFHRKTAFLVGTGLISVSEFGFIIAREGRNLAILTSDQYTFTVAVTFSAAFGGAFILSHGQTLYYEAQRRLGKLWPHLLPDKVSSIDDEKEGVNIAGHVVICGYGRVGKYIGRALEMAKIPFIVVDYNHTTVAKLRQKGITVVYGDPADIDVLDYAQVDFAKAVVVAIPDRHTQELVISNAQTLNKRITIICRTHHEEDQSRLKSLGVTVVIQPEFEASITVVEKLLPSFGVSPEDVSGKITRLKIEHGLG